ncbi:PorV/PorQ family protein [Candidatus Neomarinimicrobiota bacterium]
MKLNIKTVYLLTGLLVCSSIVFPQSDGINKVGTTSFQFLKVIPDARSTAMGGAYTAVASNSAATFSNPAALAKVQKVDIALSQVDWLLDITLQSFSVGYPVGSLGTIGLQAMIVDMGDIAETRVDHLYPDASTGTYNPGLTGNTVSPGAQVFGFSFARYITGKFAFGLTTKYVREDLVIADASGFMVDVGFTYHTRLKSLELAAAIKNFGPEVKFIEPTDYTSFGGDTLDLDGETYPLPQELSIGISGYLLGTENAFIAKSSNSSLLVAFDMVEARDYGQQYHIGLEYAFKNMFFIRGGQKINYDIEGLTLGFGIRVAGLRFDYSYASLGDAFSPVSRFSVGFGKN